MSAFKNEMKITSTNAQKISFLIMVFMVSMFNYSDNAKLDLLANASVVLFIGITLVASQWRFKLPAEAAYYAVFLCFCFLSVLCSTAPDDSMHRCIKLLILAMQFMAVYIYAKNEEDKDFILKVLAVCTSITAAFIDIKGFEVLGDVKRVSKITGDANQVSAYLALGILVMVYFVITGKMRPILPAAGIVLSYIAIIIQGSRSGILVAGLMMVVEIIVLMRHENISMTKKIGFMLVLILALTAGVYYIISNPVFYMTIGRRFMSLYEIQTTGVSSMNETSVFKRITSYRLAFERFMENPFFGKGIDSFSEFSKQSVLNRTGFCPNNYLELLQGIGFIGTAAYYMVYMGIMRKSLRCKNSLSILTICILMAMLVSHITVVFYYQKLEYIYLGIMLAIVYSKGIYENRDNNISQVR